MGDDGFYYRDGEKVGFVISVSAGDQVRIDTVSYTHLHDLGMGSTYLDPTGSQIGKKESIAEMCIRDRSYILGISEQAMLRGTGGTLSAGYRGIKSSSELRIIYYKKYGLRGRCV